MKSFDTQKFLSSISCLDSDKFLFLKPQGPRFCIFIILLINYLLILYYLSHDLLSHIWSSCNLRLFLWKFIHIFWMMVSGCLQVFVFISNGDICIFKAAHVVQSINFFFPCLWLICRLIPMWWDLHEFKTGKKYFYILHICSDDNR